MTNDYKHRIAAITALSAVTDDWEAQGITSPSEAATVRCNLALNPLGTQADEVRELGFVIDTAIERIMVILDGWEIQGLGADAEKIKLELGL